MLHATTWGRTHFSRISIFCPFGGGHGLETQIEGTLNPRPNPTSLSVFHFFDFACSTLLRFWRFSTNHDYALAQNSQNSRDFLGKLTKTRCCEVPTRWFPETSGRPIKVLINPALQVLSEFSLYSLFLYPLDALDFGKFMVCFQRRYIVTIGACTKMRNRPCNDRPTQFRGYDPRFGSSQLRGCDG